MAKSVFSKFICTILLLICCRIYSQGQEVPHVFRHLSVDQGLSNNWIKAIHRDREGYIWFGTFNGLNRFDGTNVTQYLAEEYAGLQDDFIQALEEDSQGNIWIGTFSGGLAKYERQTDSFLTYLHVPQDKASISSNQVFSLLIDSSNRLWIGTDVGLDCLNLGTGEFSHYIHQPETYGSLTRGIVSSIYEDKQGEIWVGTQSGLNRWISSSASFERFEHVPDDPTSLGFPYVKGIYEDKYLNLWVATWGGGVSILDKTTNTFSSISTKGRKGKSLSHNAVLNVIGDGENQIFLATEGGGLNVIDILTKEVTIYLPDLSDPGSLSSNSIHSLCYSDEDGILWIGGYHAGVNFFSKWDKPFQLYRARQGGLNDNHIVSIEEDLDGNIWIGTDGSGINILDPKSQRFSYLNEHPELSGRVGNNTILSLMCDQDNQMWVGTYNGGLSLISADRKRITSFHHDPQDPSSLSDERVNSIYQDKQGNIWVGTMRGGLNLLNREEGTFERFQHDPDDPESISNDFIYGVFEDRLGRILVQTGAGLEILDVPSRTFSRFADLFQMDFNVPIDVYEDRQGNFWIGSLERGIFQIARDGETVTQISEADGLPSNSIMGILEDEQGSMWVSTHRGLCKIQPNGDSGGDMLIFQYSAEDGLQGSEFKRGAACLLKSGEMVFAGQNGFNLFNPVSIRHNPFVPPVVLTDLKLFNQSVSFSQGNTLSAPIDEADMISLAHDESVITFEFAALNYLLPEKNQYAYQLENFEESWNYVDRRQSATYTNLDPGEYVFRVKASNNDGIWNETGTSILVLVSPPWWELTFVRILGGILFLLLGVTSFRIRTHQLERSKKILEHKVSVRTKDLLEANRVIEERQQEIVSQNKALTRNNQELATKSTEIERMSKEIRQLNEAKIRFFTNVSHELRTPLNLIVWPLEELLRDQKFKEEHDRLSLIQQNAHKLIQLINQLLDFRKVEAGTLKLSASKVEVRTEIRRIVLSFGEWSRKKQVSLAFGELDHIETCLDVDKFDKILSNLLSNALKYTDEGGTIRVNVQKESRGAALILSVEDDGKGMDQEELTHIFERFYEGQSSGFPGSGIGLSLVKELVELHGGRVWAESRPGAGSAFYVSLPVTEDCREEASLTLQQTELSPISESAMLRASDQDPNQNSDTQPLILLVEDQEDILSYMRARLSNSYRILTASNGVEALKVVEESHPELVVCDVMMPEMDGLEFCRRVKSQESISHIPVLMATAKGSEEDLLEGYQQGADDYLIKPYSLDVLRMKIRNILFSRQRLKEQFAKGSQDLPSQLHVNQLDEEFLRKAIEAVNAHLDDSTFGVEDFSEYFHMSRRNVLRKLKAITGLSINEFIRHTRLKKAYQMLQTESLNISEVAYSVGFTDPKYFSQCFKAQFGVLPSKVRQT